MRKLIIIFMFLMINVWFALGWTPPSPITPPDTIPDAIANMNFGIIGGSVPAGGAATDYTSDGSMVSYWMLEQASGATAVDGHANSNDLAASSDGSGPTQSADAIQGTYSQDFNSGDSEYFALADASLSAGFPGKETTGSAGSFSVGCWVKIDTDNVMDIISKDDGNTGSYKLRYNNPFFIFSVTANGYSATTITDNTAITEDGIVWYHVVGVFDNTNDEIEIFVNGTLNVSAVAYVGLIFLGDIEFRLGKKDAIFDGHIDEAFIMSRDLSAAEVLEIYTSGLAGER